MFRRTALALMIPALLATASFAADPDPKIPPVKRITGVKPEAGIFKSSSRKKPVVIKSAEEAAKHFGKDEAEKLAKLVDFKQQIVVVFAWRGSGQDKMTTLIAESFPEQVTFKYKPGRTRDLRPHVYIFALRSNVKWKVG